MSARAVWIVTAAIAGLAVAGPAAAAPTVEVQNLKWFVVGGIGAGEGLAHWQGVIDQGMAEAQVLLQGDQGPADVPCCVDVRRASLTSITAPTLQAVDLASDYDDMTTRCVQSGGGSCAFLVDSITHCGGPSPGSIGCADTPECEDTLPNDDPTLVLVVSLDALEQGSFAATIAHERGHNACLTHVPSPENPTTEPCSLMRAAAGGGCLNATECGFLRDAGNADGGTCACHTDALGTVADAASCSEDAISGICSGGVCAEIGSDASVQLVAAGATEFPAAGPADEALRLSGVPGGWSDTGGFASALHDLAYAASRDAVFAVTAADQLLRVDPATGATLATIATLPATGSGFYLSGNPIRYDGIAFDPGPTASPDDDQLYAVRQAETCSPLASCDAELVTIDPDDGTTTFLGDLNTTFSDGVQSLAYDTLRNRLYATGFALGSLFEIEPACDIGFEFCNVLDVVEVQLPRIRSSLAYAEATDRLYLVGTQTGDRVLYDSIDAGTFAVNGESIGIDGFRPGGLVALPIPEPGAFAAAAAALLALAGRARRRR